MKNYYNNDFHYFYSNLKIKSHDDIVLQDYRNANVYIWEFINFSINIIEKSIINYY